jgi:chromosome partitioning protein
VILQTDIKNLDVLPENIQLAAGEMEIFADATRSRETRLKKAISDLDYDFVFIDCPPSLGILSMNALTAADYVIIPVKPGRFSLDGLSNLLNTITIVQEDFNPGLKIMGVVITQMGAVGNVYKSFDNNMNVLENLLGSR